MANRWLEAISPESLALQTLGSIAQILEPAAGGVDAAALPEPAYTLPPLQLDDILRAVAYLNVWQDMTNLMPNVRTEANQTMHRFLREKFNKDIDPHAYFLNWFKSGAGSDKTFTGWEHANQRPVRSIRLSELPIVNFRANDDIHSDELNECAGVYSTNSVDNYDETNELQVLPGALHERFEAIDFMSVFTALLDHFFEQHGSTFKDYLVSKVVFESGRRVDSLAAMPGKITERAWNIVLAALGYEQGIKALGDAKVSVSTFDINGYPSSNMYVLTDNQRTWLLYAPTMPERIIQRSSMRELKNAFYDMARSPSYLHLLNGFSLYNRQDGSMFWGVDSWFNSFFRKESFGSSEYYICRNPEIVSDWPGHMYSSTRARIFGDTNTMIKSRGEVAEDLALHYLAALDTVVPFFQPLTSPVEVGIHVHQAVSADTSQERAGAKWGLAGDAFNIASMLIPDLHQASTAIERSAVSFKYDSTRRAWHAGAAGKFSDQIQIEDFMSEGTPTAGLPAEGLFQPSILHGAPGQYIYGTGSSKVVQIGDDLVPIKISTALNEFVVSTAQGAWGSIAKFDEGRWVLAPSPVRAGRGVWTFDHGHTAAQALENKGLLGTVNGRPGVVLTLYEGKTYLSDAPGGAPMGDPLSAAGKKGWATSLLAPELAVDWTCDPGNAEAIWLYEAKVASLDYAHLYPDETGHLFTDVDGLTYLDSSDGFYPVEKTDAGGLRMANNGPLISRTGDVWKLDFSSHAYEYPVVKLDDVVQVTDAFIATGQQVTGSHGFGFIVAMRSAGFRGTVDQLVEWIRTPRSILVEKTVGSAHPGGRVLRDGEKLEGAVHRNLFELQRLLHDQQVVSVAIEDIDRGETRIVSIVPPMFAKDDAMGVFDQLRTTEDSASLFQVLSEGAYRDNVIIRRVMTNRPMTLSDYALVYSHTPDALVSAPRAKSLLSEIISRPARPSRRFALDKTQCGVRQRRAPGCAVWHTAIDRALNTPIANRIQALNHQVLSSDAATQLLVHDHRLYRASAESAELAQVPASEYGSIPSPLRPLNEVTGFLRVDGAFGASSFEGTEVLDLHSLVVELGAIVEGVSDSRTLRATHWPVGIEDALVVEPMPGVFYKAQFQMPLGDGSLNGLQTQPLKFVRLNFANVADSLFIDSHIAAWNVYQGGERLPLPRKFFKLPDIREIANLMERHGYLRREIEAIFLRYQGMLGDVATRTHLLRCFQLEGLLPERHVALPMPKTSITPPPQGDALSTHIHYATSAFTIVTEHFKATGIGSSNQHLGNDLRRQLVTQPMVKWVQSHWLNYREYPHYYDLVLRTGAGNCDDMALTAAKLINDAGGYAESWIMPGTHRFAVVGKPPLRERIADFNGPDWDSIRVVDPWIGWHGPAREYRANFRRIMQEWKNEGREILYTKPGAVEPDWIDPTDAAWLAATSAPIRPAYPPRSSLLFPPVDIPRSAMETPASTDPRASAPAFPAGVPVSSSVVFDPTSIIHGRDPDDPSISMMGHGAIGIG